MAGLKARLDHPSTCFHATPGMDWVCGYTGPLLAIFGYRKAIALAGDLVKSGNM